MSELCKLGYGKWELTIRECEPNKRGIQLGETHAGEFYFNGESFVAYRNGKPSFSGSKPEEIKAWAAFFGIRLSNQDARDLEALERAADDLCAHLNEGFSVDAWSQRRLVQDSKAKPKLTVKDYSDLRANPLEGAHVIAASDHRNGRSGAPFGVVLFEDDGKDGSRKVGIWFKQGGEGCHCAVLDVNKLAAGDIAWGSNSWRGDHYEPILRRVVEHIRREKSPDDFGPDYWKQIQRPRPNVEPKVPKPVTPTAEATREAEQPVQKLMPESRELRIARLYLGRFSSNLIAAWNPQSESFTYTAHLFCDDRPTFVPMGKHDLRSLQVLSDNRGLPWLREQLPRRGCIEPNVKDLQQFQELLRVNEALIGRFIKLGHIAVLKDQKLAEDLGMQVLEIDPGRGEQPTDIGREGNIGERPSTHDPQVSTLDVGHKGEQHMATQSIATMELGTLRAEVYRHQSQSEEYYSFGVRRPFVGKDGAEKLTFDTREEDIQDLVAMLQESAKIMHEDRLERCQENAPAPENRIRITGR